MARIPVSSLSLKGWVDTIPEELDKLLSYYFLSEKSQSLFYDIFSLPYHIASKGNSPKQIKTLITNDLTLYFHRYFPEGATIDVEVIELDAAGNQKARYDIRVGITVRVDGRDYDVAKEVSIIDSQIGKIANYVAG